MSSPTNQSPIIQNIDDEHKQMRTMLGDVHSILKSRSASVANVKAALDKLQDYLNQHFHNEDEGGFFQEIVSQAPRLSERANDVSGEHAGLLAAFTEFAERAGQGDGSPSWWEKTSDDFHQLSKQLMEHEHREQELLQQAFTEDIGAGD